MSRLKTLFLAISISVSAPVVCAQNNFNEVIRFGARDLVQAATHPVTNFPLEVPGAQPTAYMATSTTGVATGTLTWIWYPSQLNRRIEDRQITGHMIAVRPSTATPLADYSKKHPGQGSAGVPVYIPKFSVYSGKKRASMGPPLPFGPGYDPDFTKSPLLTYNTVHTPLVQPAQADKALLWTVTYNTKINVSKQELVLAFEWQGGEHFSKPRSQSLPTGWSEAMFQPSHWGWAAPAPGRAITRFDSKQILPGTNLDIYSSPMGGYFEDQATICFHSDWGENREPLLKGNAYPSYNVGSGLADVGSTAGELGWDVFTTPAHQGMRALPLLNIKTTPHNAATPLLGRTLEVDPGDANVAMLWGEPLVDGRIGTFGTWLPPRRLKVPVLGPAAIGLWVGMEFAITDTGTGNVPATTQAFWFYIEK